MSQEAGARLDSFLKEAVAELGGVMPEASDTGAKKGVASLADTMAQVKDMIAQSIGRSQAKMIEQGQKMARELEANSDLVVKKMEEQHQDALQQFNDLLGNERAGDQ